MTDKYHLTGPVEHAIFQWLVYSGMREHDDRAYVVVPQAFIRSLQRGACVEKTLESFQEKTGLSLDVLRYDRWNGKATAARPVLDLEANDLIRDEVYAEDADKEDFITGGTWSRSREFAGLQEQRKAVDAFRTPGHPAEEIVTHLHSLRVRRAQRRLICSNRPGILAAIEEVTGSTKTGDSKRDLALRLYQNARYAHLHYSTGGNTDRIHPCGGGLMLLPRQVRRAGFAGCVSFDMKHAQFSIVSELWQIPKAMEFLATGEDLWEYLAGELGLDLVENKSQIKRALYTIIYGGGLKRIKEEFPLAEDFVSIPLIEQMIEYRGRTMRRIIADGYIADAFGKTIGLWDFPAERHRNYDDARARTLAARQVQSYEMAIMRDGYMRLVGSRDMLPVAWLHDGLYAKPTHHAESARYTAIQTAHHIEHKAREYGFHIKVDTETMN